jgi:predicted acetyltransferase
MITFFEIDPVNFIEIAKTFNKDDFRIFPTSKRPKYFLSIKNLYKINLNQAVIGDIYVLKNTSFSNNEVAREVCIYIQKNHRSMGIGKLALSKFMKENGSLFFIISQKNKPMLRIVSDDSKFSQSLNIDKREIYLLKQ